MINYLKIAVRNLRKQPAFSVINLTGLTTGIGVFMLIMLWVNYELSYNAYHPQKDRIAAVMHHQKISHETMSFPAVSGLLAPALMQDVPEIDLAATTSWGDNRQFTVENKNFIEYGLYATPEFLKIFHFPLISGQANQILSDPHTVLITEKLAKKYFPQEDPVGKSIIVEQNTPYQVSGVLQDIPQNSTFSFDFLMPLQDYIGGGSNENLSWTMNNLQAYVLWAKGVNFEEANSKIKNILARYTNQQPNSTLSLWKLDDWYLRNDFKEGKYGGGGRFVYVRLFMLIGIIILILACINFMNLSTARATQRAKEVGVRKVIGANRPGLARQFISESLLYAALAGIIALWLLFLVLPYFNQFFRKDIHIEFTNYQHILIFTAIVLSCGLLAGSYPAWILSAFKPIEVLKNINTPSASSAWLRKSLVVFQFIISIALVTATLVIAQQINFINNRDLGYNKEQLIWFQNNISTDKNQLALQEFTKIPGVKSASLLSTTFTMSNNRGTQVSWPGKTDDQTIFFNFMAASNKVVETMGLQITEGRGFSDNYLADTGAFILNEVAVKQMGLENPVGQLIDTYGGRGKIVGVVKDFHFESLHTPIAPVIITCRPEWTWNIYVRLEAGDLPAIISRVEDAYQSFAPGFVFEYNFQDQEYNRLYRSEYQIGSLVKWFAGFAIFISCLGLLGLTLFTVERKTKEIGIRKVLGASPLHIMSLMAGQFGRPILIAGILATLPANYIMQNWLAKFAYHINLNWWLFGISAALILGLSLLIISILTFRYALLSPVTNLRTE